MSVIIDATMSEVESVIKYARYGANNCMIGNSWEIKELVRCKDCRHRDPEDHKCDSGEMERQGCPFKVADDYFCAYGER